MKDTLLKSSWDVLAGVLAVIIVAFALVSEFWIGQHYMRPTGVLMFAVILGNFSRRGFLGERWAKYCLFWFGFLMTCMAFMGLFFAQRPKVWLGDFFIPVWAVLALFVAWLTWQYKRRNSLSL